MPSIDGRVVDMGHEGNPNDLTTNTATYKLWTWIDIETDDGGQIGRVKVPDDWFLHLERGIPVRLTVFGFD